ncbi:MAG: T9SS type A sorting domain-containing protein, partial [Bacteroidales bacterium]
DNYVHSIAIDESGSKWIGTYEGLAQFYDTNWTIYNISNSGLPNNIVLTIDIEANGTKWIGTWGGGVAEFDTTNWTTYDALNSGLPFDWIISAAIDEYGSIWFGTYGGGLAVYNENGVPVSIKEQFTLHSKITIYPNPAFTAITIETPTTPQKNTFMIIIDITGKQLIQRQITEKQTVVDVSGLSQGVYFLRVANERTVMVGKFIKSDK